jgi:hypothetical protein
MAEILHLLMGAKDELAAEIIAGQKAQGRDVKTIDLRLGEPDYEEVVNEIFRASSVETWPGQSTVKTKSS